MTAAAPIEDFLEAVTAQLDKTQDALRLKAVNRPLTFALKDFAIDLSVFVEMDRDGLVRLRPSGPNETGASTMRIGFTTITRPMIEENTISMELAQSPSLEEVGFDQDEASRLQRLGVRNAAQLRRLREQSDEESVARFSGVDPGRLRRAMQTARPRIDYVDIGAGRRTSPRQQVGAPPPQVQLRPGQRRLRIRGRELSSGSLAAQVSLDGSVLPIHSFSASHLDLDLPDNTTSGTLEVTLPDGEVEPFELIVDQEVNGSDPWADQKEIEGETT